MIAAPAIVLAMVMQAWGFAFFLFLFACITDLIDGYLARLLKQKTFLGACLDPIADKVLILSVFFTLAFIESPSFMIPKWFVWLVLFKESFLVAGAFYLYHRYGHLEIRPRLLGKVTTFAQMCFIIWLFACYFFHWSPNKTYLVLLGTLLILIITTFLHYFLIGLSWLETSEQ